MLKNPTVDQEMSEQRFFKMSKTINSWCRPCPWSVLWQPSTSLPPSCAVFISGIWNYKPYINITKGPQVMYGRRCFGDHCWDRILGRNWDKSFPPCYLKSPLQIDSPPALEKKWVENGLQCKNCIRKPQVWELSRLCPETSTNLYVHKCGIREPTY